MNLILKAKKESGPVDEQSDMKIILTLYMMNMSPIACNQRWWFWGSDSWYKDNESETSGPNIKDNSENGKQKMMQRKWIQRWWSYP